LNRYKEMGAHSGPLTCQNFNSLQLQDEKLEAHLDTTPNAPMEEIQPCEKSPPVRNFEELEEKHPEWIKKCYTKAMKLVVAEFNPFYKKFARFVEKLAWASGCGSRSEKLFGDQKKDGWSGVAQHFDAGSFGTCNWQREAEKDAKMYHFDDEKARGWLGQNLISLEELAKVKTQYPLPQWLHNLRRMQTCMQQTAAGKPPPNLTPKEQGLTEAVSEIMESATLDDQPNREMSSALLSIMQHHTLSVVN